jgi:hypothetical protein
MQRENRTSTTPQLDVCCIPRLMSWSYWTSSCSPTALVSFWGVWCGTASSPFPAHNCGRAANLTPNLHKITIYGASIHSSIHSSIHLSSVLLCILAGAILAALTAPWRNWHYGVHMLLEASYCRYQHLHDPPAPSGSNASTHQWPYCPLRLLANLLSAKTRYINAILGGNSRNRMREFFLSLLCSESQLFRSPTRARS